jgi:hypothetical protein
MQLMGGRSFSSGQGLAKCDKPVHDNHLEHSRFSTYIFTMHFIRVRQQRSLAWWVRGSAFIVFAIGWFERRDFWPLMAAGILCTFLSFVVDDRIDVLLADVSRVHWNWPFWTVLVFSLPSISAVLLVAFVLASGASSSMWALPIVLYFYIPVGLVLSSILASFSQHSMSEKRRRRMWQALAVALSAVPVTYVLLWLLSLQRP